MQLVKKFFKQFSSNRKIIFSPIEKDQVFDIPVPAVRCIPEWFKSTPATWDHKPIHIDDNYNTNATVKSCPPFIDAFSLGYMFVLPMDVQIEIHRDEGLASVKWQTGRSDFVSTHSTDQFPVSGIHKNDIYQPFKWLFPFKISTPPGYSTLFTHPLNRNDLPFKTLSGVVDTDNYPINVNFPFVISPPLDKDFFIIEANTPISQIIPFKRENWNHIESNTPVSEKDFFSLKKKIQNSYKKQWRVKKRFR